MAKVLDRVARVSLRSQHLNKELMESREMALVLPREMSFRKGEKQQKSLNVGIADTFEEEQSNHLTGAVGINTKIIGNECRRVIGEKDQLGKFLRNFLAFILGRLESIGRF